MNDVHDMFRTSRPRCIPKVVAADAELGNSILGLDTHQKTGHLASRAVLREVDGVASNSANSAPLSPAPYYDGTGFVGSDGLTDSMAGVPYVDTPSESPYAAYNPQDVGRKYLPSNGGCIYIDLDHVEICTPEVLSARDFVATWHALLRIVRRAASSANARRRDGERIVVLVNSSDGLGNAYGSHLNFLITRELFDNLFIRRLHPDLFLLAAHQVSSIVLTGQGKVGSENDRPPVDFQLSQRADFFDRIVALQTTNDRPIVNCRDEPLCGPRQGRHTATGYGAGLARLHCIFYDSTLSHVATFLKVGMMQLVLSMLEGKRLDADLMLDDPVAALTVYSHDPDLRVRARLADGRQVSAVELQRMLCERARVHLDDGGFDGLVPDAAVIVELWEETLEWLVQRDFDRLSSRLDWVLKRAQIHRALTDRGLDWSAPEAKHLDHLYASLDVDEGLYWALESAGCTQTLEDDARIEHFVDHAPEDTRAWTRAMLLRGIPRERIRSVDWDHIDIASPHPGDPPLHIGLPDPLDQTRAHWESNLTVDCAREDCVQPHADADSLTFD